MLHENTINCLDKEGNVDALKLLQGGKMNDKNAKKYD